MIYIILYCLQTPPSIFCSMYCLRMMQYVHNSHFQICFDETEGMTNSLIARTVEIQSCVFLLQMWRKQLQMTPGSTSFLQHTYPVDS
jgi:hypothetical protein